MRRKVTKSGNDSFSIVLPKPWVIKNHLKPRADVEVTESANKLIINPGIVQCESDEEVIPIQSEHEDVVISKLIHIYREGYNKVRITHAKGNKEMLDKLTKFASKMHGVTIVPKDDSIIMTATEGIQKKSAVLNKSYHTLLWLSEVIADETRNSLWQKQVFDLYEQVYFLSEYVFRIITLEGSSDFRLSMRQYVAAGTLQYLAEVLKNIAEIEYDNSLNTFFGGVASDLKKLIKAMYEICMLSKNPEEYYCIRTTIIQKITERKYNVSCIGYAHMCEYFCTKLVRQEMEPIDE